jgi:hypothetical protein
MDKQRQIPTSRRQLLAGTAAAAIGAIGAESLLGAPSASATDGAPVIAGTTNQETGTTEIHNTNTASGTVAVWAHADSSGIGLWGTSGSGTCIVGGTSGTTGDGVEGRTDDAGHSGIFGHNESTSSGGKGVFGASANGIGVEGDGGQTGVLGAATGAGDGVQGTTSDSGHSGVYGLNKSSSPGKGVFGASANGVGVAGNGGQIGVLGTASRSSAAIQGTNSGPGPSVRGGDIGTVGDGVEARTDDNLHSGVYAHNESSVAGGKAIFAVSANGIGLEATGGQLGVHAVSSPTGSGVGLSVYGRSVFRTAGTTTAPAGASHISIALSGVTPADFVLATVQKAGSVYVKNAVAGTGAFTIYLNEATTSATKIGWFVISLS